MPLAGETGTKANARFKKQHRIVFQMMGNSAESADE
jgi:hypothetical protein